jgi:hypothetical protein
MLSIFRIARRGDQVRSKLLILLARLQESYPSFRRESAVGLRGRATNDVSTFNRLAEFDGAPGRTPQIEASQPLSRKWDKKTSVIVSMLFD